MDAFGSASGELISFKRKMIRQFILLIVSVTLSLAGDYNYGQVVEKSLLFYEAQRTGRLPANNRISWRGDSFVTDSGTNNEDLSGGYFDGKDFFLFYLFTVFTKIN